MTQTTQEARTALQLVELIRGYGHDAWTRSDGTLGVVSMILMPPYYQNSVQFHEVIPATLVAVKAWLYGPWVRS